MPSAEFPRVQRGDRSVPAALLNGLAGAVEALRDPQAEGGLVFGMPAAVPDYRDSFLARITATNSSVPPAYSWTRLYDLDQFGAAADWPGPVVGTATDLPAFELSGNPDVPVDGTAIVQLWPSLTGPDSFEFAYPAIAGTLTHDLTFKGNVIFEDGHTVTVKSDSWSFGGPTYPTDVTINYGGWTINNTAVFKFAYSGSPSVAPGILSLPAQTVPGKPTWTPTPAQGYPEVYVPADGKQYKWDGSNWIPFSKDPLTTLGDIPVYGPTGTTRFPIGSPGQVLTADPAQPNALAWEDPQTSTQGYWRFDATSTSMSNPGSGKIRFNTATPSTATQLAISVTTSQGTDATRVLQSLTTGDSIYIQDQGNSANWVRYKVNGTQTNNTTWFQIPVALYATGSYGGTLPSNNSPLVVSFGSGGGGAGGGTVGGSGTAGKLPYWVTGTTLGDSYLSQTGGGVSVANNFSVTGTGNFTGALSATGAISSATRYDCSGFAGASATVSGLTFTGGIYTNGTISAFAAAGGSHAAGLVPDPGATSHSNRPMVLKDNAAFAFLTGEVLASQFIATDEATTSTTYVQLTTHETITFSLDATTTVLLQYQALAYNSTSPAAMRVRFNIDGVASTPSIAAYTTTGGGAVFLHGMLWSVSLGSGSHTIYVEHNVSAGTGDWFNRFLMAMAL